MQPKFSPMARLLIVALVLPIIAACGAAPAAPEVIQETVVVTAEPQIVVATPEPGETPTAATAAETEAATEQPAAEGTLPYSTPHPILSDVRVRQAIAHCINRLELIESVYPYLSPEQQEGLLMDTFLTRDHWAFPPDGAGLTLYPFDPERGDQLLTEAGWTNNGAGVPRTNADGESLSLKFLTTDAQFRQTWAAVMEQQLLENCGIQIIRTHAPGSFVFGQNTGLSRRDFELAAFAWVGDADPKGRTLYACDQIPSPANNWEGQNYMGWCNERASQAIIAANNAIDRDVRAQQYIIVQEEFTRDMVSLPLFNRLGVAAASTRLENFRPDPTEYVFANAYEWQLTDGGDTVVVAMTQEPETLFTLVNSQATAVNITYLIGAVAATSYSYDYQPVGLTRLPSLDNGGAVLNEVEVSAGDMVWDTSGTAVELAPGVEIQTADGKTITYEDGTVTMNQLVVTFEHVEGITWEDGEPRKQADYELGHRISCDKTSGAVTYTVCESQEQVEFLSDTSYRITYLPGALWSLYSVFSLAAYPSHQVLADGRRLADVPASEWATLEEVAERPLSDGPYRVVSWEKGQRMILEANPYFYLGEVPIKNFIIEFIPNATQAVAQLLTGAVDVIPNQDLSGTEIETVLQAAEEGQIQAEVIPSPTWEHVDFNLNIR